MRICHLRRKTGRLAEVEFVSNLYGVDHQQVIQCNIRDITIRNQLERAKVTARTLADTNRQKDEFLAMLSHELRNPLAAIMNASHLLRIESGNRESSSNKRRGESSSVRWGNWHIWWMICWKSLESAPAGSGSSRRHVDMRGILTRAEESVRPLIHQRRHKLTVKQAPEPIWLHADPVRLEQVVVNLLTNAAKYTSEGGEIWVTLQQEGNEALLSVRDSGVGIAPDLLPRIFDLFTQAERSLDRSQGGLGIGLTLVQRLVEMHGGRVAVISQLGVGSEFVVRLPLLSLQTLAISVESYRNSKED